MNYNDYQKARNAAWQTLRTFGISELPVRVSDICRKNKMILYDYERGGELAVRLGVASQMKKADGFTYLLNGQYYIFYRPKMSVGRTRFTVAHELGHIVLGHLRENRVTQLNREPDPKDSPTE